MARKTVLKNIKKKNSLKMNGSSLVNVNKPFTKGQLIETLAEKVWG